MLQMVRITALAVDVFGSSRFLEQNRSPQLDALASLLF